VLVQRYSDVVFRTACLITGSAAAAEDAAQEAFMKAYTALPRFRPGAPLRPWLLKIASNEARNQRRAALRRARFELRVAPEDTQSSPEWEAESAEQRRRLLAAVATLAHDDQLVIACRYFLDLSGQETAAVLGCAEGTVKSRLSRALSRLRTVLEKTDG
jgi:RNA polymerase sigma-70 factor (ECF subfamily)